MAIAERNSTLRKILPEPFERCSLEFAPPPHVKTDVVPPSDYFINRTLWLNCLQQESYTANRQNETIFGSESS